MAETAALEVGENGLVAQRLTYSGKFLRGGIDTYKIPSDKIAAIADLTLQFIWTSQSMGMGSKAKMTSVRTATLELKKAANLRCVAGMQTPPSIVESQINARGRHWKKTVTCFPVCQYKFWKL